MDSTLITQIVQQVAAQHPGTGRLNDLFVIIGWAVVFLLWHYRWRLLGLVGQKKKDSSELSAVLPVIQSDLVEIKTGVKDLRENVALEREYTRKDIDKLYSTTDTHSREISTLNERTRKL